MSNPQTPSSAEWLDEILFLKLGLDLTRKDAQYPIVPAKDLQEARQAILAHIKQQLLEAYEQGYDDRTLEADHELEEKLKAGFYAGQAMARVELEDCHKNWKKWNEND